MEKLNHYSVENVIDTYQIRRKKENDCTVLRQWLNVSLTKLDEYETRLLQLLPQELEEWQYAWNEEELKMYFIAPLIRIANINEKGVIGTFFERKLKGIVNNITISVTCDCMIANTKLSGNPDLPFFFLQEFKRSKGDSHDPEGQMLAAMILAQSLNQNGKTMYGSWIQGRFWYFTTLIQQDYCVSKPLDATNENDLWKIVFMLKKLKKLVIN